MDVFRPPLLHGADLDDVRVRSTPSRTEGAEKSDWEQVKALSCARLSAGDLGFPKIQIYYRTRGTLIYTVPFETIGARIAVCPSHQATPREPPTGRLKLSQAFDYG